MIVHVKITEFAVGAFARRGIYLDTTTVLPAFQDPFPYELLFNWVGHTEIKL